jgi:hypothetical protein
MKLRADDRASGEFEDLGDAAAVRRGGDRQLPEAVGVRLEVGQVERLVMQFER